MFDRKLATLGFEGSSIRLLATQGDKVLEWETISLAREALSRGQVLDPAEVGGAIDALLRSHRLNRNRVISSITGERALARVISVPALNARQLEGTVKRKVKQEISLSPQETDLSWKVVGQKNGNLDVFVLALPREIIDRHMQALHAARVRPRALDIKPLALLRAVNERDAIIVNLEEQSLTLLIVVGGVPAIVRTVPVRAADSSPQSRIEFLGQELARTTKFYNEGHKDTPLPRETPVYATGATFESAMLVERLASQTSYLVRSPRPPLTYPEDLPVAEFSVNLGLALKKL